MKRSAASMGLAVHIHFFILDQQLGYFIRAGADGCIVKCTVAHLLVRHVHPECFEVQKLSYHLKGPVQGAQMDGRVALKIDCVQHPVVVLSVHILDQNLEQSNVVALARQMNRVIAVQVSHGQVGIGLEQKLAQVQFFEMRCHQQWCKSGLVSQIDYVLVRNGHYHVHKYFKGQFPSSSAKFIRKRWVLSRSWRERFLANLSSDWPVRSAKLFILL
ncbi:hypothetical protein BpHYR1_042986 [Brachionus plicatilis]|uniref:Uncharacterized protein n=1 Tax=Brachionus plicatilis TaxID=10195 RepID=A0A3M7PPV2_BRAPC|nr:hypothetical protein BpHYR1_042986 [Brachionus plicatilis]